MAQNAKLQGSQPIRARHLEKARAVRLVVLGFSELFLICFNLKGIIPFQSVWFSFNFSRNNGQIRHLIFPAIARHDELDLGWLAGLLAGWTSARRKSPDEIHPPALLNRVKTRGIIDGKLISRIAWEVHDDLGWDKSGSWSVSTSPYVGARPVVGSVQHPRRSDIGKRFGRTRRDVDVLGGRGEKTTDELRPR